MQVIEKKHYYASKRTIFALLLVPSILILASSRQAASRQFAIRSELNNCCSWKIDPLSIEG